jgi:hypothetical protein
MGYIITEEELSAGLCLFPRGPSASPESQRWPSFGPEDGSETPSKKSY